MSSLPQSHPEATVVVYIFVGPDGQRSHLVQVEGQLPPVLALRLALAAIAGRLLKRNF